MRRWIGLAMALPLTGCLTVGESFKTYALDRAAFELHCAKDDLQVQGLNGSLEGEPQAGTQVGVSGCGKRAVYVLTMGGGWVLNSVDNPDDSDSNDEDRPKKKRKKKKRDDDE